MIYESKNEVNGRILTSGDIEQIKEIVKLYPRLSRQEIVKTVCVNLRWMSIVNSEKEKAVANFLLGLEEKGLIKLPLPKREINSNSPGNKFPFKKKHVISISEKTDSQEEIYGIINDFMPVGLELINNMEKESLWDEYIERYHELKYGSPFGDRLKYFISISGEKPKYAGCMMFSASSWALEERDKWINWTKQDRMSRLYLVVNNTRFLIFPWIKVRNLASWALAEASRRIRKDWWRKHRYEPVLLETFVDTQKYTGASYKAANWIYLGNTKGYGRQSRGKKHLSSPKQIYMYPLVEDFRDYLTGKKEAGGDSK